MVNLVKMKKFNCKNCFIYCLTQINVNQGLEQNDFDSSGSGLVQVKKQLSISGFFGF